VLWESSLKIHKTESPHPDAWSQLEILQVAKIVLLQSCMGLITAPSIIMGACRCMTLHVCLQSLRHLSHQRLQKLVVLLMSL